MCHRICLCFKLGRNCFHWFCFNVWDPKQFWGAVWALGVFKAPMWIRQHPRSRTRTPHSFAFLCLWLAAGGGRMTVEDTVCISTWPDCKSELFVARDLWSSLSFPTQLVSHTMLRHCQRLLTVYLTGFLVSVSRPGNRQLEFDHIQLFVLFFFFFPSVEPVVCSDPDDPTGASYKHARHIYWPPECCWVTETHWKGSLGQPSTLLLPWRREPFSSVQVGCCVYCCGFA